MSATIYPLRLSAVERKTFKRSASAEGKKLSEWLRAAAHDRVKTKAVRRRAACLDYPDTIQLSEEAETNPKEFIRKTLAAKRELYR
jgi:hypothetical protein